MVSLYRILGDVQAKTCPARLDGAAVIQAHEAPEQRGRLLRQDADAVVDDIDARHAIIPIGADDDRRVVVGVFDGVAEQVAYDLLDVARIDLHA